MRLTAIILVLLIWLPSGAATSDFKYSFSVGGGKATLSGGDFFNFETINLFSFSVGHRLSDGWQLDMSYADYKFTNNTAADSIGSLWDLSNNSPMDIKATHLGIMINRNLLSWHQRLHLTVGAGGGLLIWKGIEPAGDTTYTVPGQKNELSDFDASELVVSGAGGLMITPKSRWSLHLLARADYLTSAGAEFSEAVSSARDRLLVTGLAKLSVYFGRVEKTQKWKSDENWALPPTDNAGRRRRAPDSDGDGVIDANDDCDGTPSGALVDRSGCAIDSDRDGVADGLDHCPRTPASAKGQVDIHGCPVDSDFDGIADYIDSCPDNAVGAVVDPSGCPIDSDNDGVPDGLDDCPFTLVGIDVDKNGCIDLTMFSTPMILNIDYASGAFDMDPRSRERLGQLAGLLNFVQSIKLEINGYTDNIGAAAANRKLSLKRANRVRQYLITMGVVEERIKVFGRGETNFLESNQKASGRAKNRRIEIVFYK